ncbi:MAG: mechanosensitive ion channel [Methanotrichaceae archaeon]|nr:mechanosensitive ion channel [Methanotrichaceae archaeon]
MIAGHINTASIDVLRDTIFRIDPIYIIFTVVVIIIILFLTTTAARIVDSALQIYIPRFTARVEVKMDQTMQLMIRRLVSASIYAVGIMLVILQIPQLHSLAMAMLAGAGIASLAIGFAAKDSLSNLTSGIFIAIFQPIRVGDRVDFRGDYGKIEDLTLRHIVIRTWDNRRIVVPNSIVSNDPIINWTIKDPEIAWPVDFMIAAALDIDQARAIILDEASRHPLVLKDRKNVVLLTEAKEAKYNLRLFMRVPSRSIAYRTGCEIREAVEKRFALEKISISK